jgi:hypothetical protein
MNPNHTFFKLAVINNFLSATTTARNNLLNECVGKGGTDPVIRMRRFRMLSQLSQFEADTIKKIYNLEADYDADSLVHGLNNLLNNVRTITDRDA